ncbi:MAG: hypothetical protein P8L44_01300 [Opitutales bacterium]|nr:hypothetical protein [Opitutales bacterium]
MPAKKRSFSLLFFLWPASLLAAFFIGRLSLSNDPSATYQASLLESSDKTESKSLTDIRYDTPPPEESAIAIEGIPDPLLQIRSAITESDPLKRMSLLTDAFSKLNKDNIMDGVALLDSMPDSQLKRQMEALLYNTWGKLDGPAAMEYVNSLEDTDSGGDRGRGGRGRGGRDGGGTVLRNSTAVMSGWAEVDPQNAVAYASENGDASARGGRNPLMLSAMQGWANTNIEGAINYAMTEIDTSSDQGGRGRGGGIENFLIARYVNEDPQAAGQWALSQSDPETRNDAIGTIARSMAGDSPQDAALWAQAISDPEAQAEALRGTASGWAREDPQAAMEWAMNIEDQTVSSQATRTALGTWAREDPYSASDYVIEMEPGATKDQAASTLSQSLIREDPEMALLWAESISDPALQTKTLAPITEGWMKKNPEQATEWINASNLPDETKQELLTPKKRKE